MNNKISSTYNIGGGVTITAPEPLRNLRQGEFKIVKDTDEDFSSIVLTGEQLGNIKKVIKSLREIEEAPLREAPVEV